MSTHYFHCKTHDTGDRGRGRGHNGRVPEAVGVGQGRGQRVPLDLGLVDSPPTHATATPPPPVIPTLSLSEGLPAMRMIPTPESREVDHEDGDDAPPPPEPDPMPYPQVDNPLSEEEDIAVEKAAVAQTGYELKKGAPHGRIPKNIFDRLVEFWRQEDWKKLQRTNTKNWASETDGSLYMGRSTTYPGTKERMLFQEAFEVENQRLEAERQAIIDAGGPKPPLIDEEAIWTRIAGSRKKGRIYGKCVVPAYSVPLIIGDVNDNDIATSPPDVIDQVTLLNREISQQAEAHRQRVAQVEAVCDEKVRTLETALESQSQEVSQLRKAYSNLYNFLEQMRSGASGSAAFTAMSPHRLRRCCQHRPRLDL
ncbi:hypothetical protein PIB30_098868 [Stylosanthes scabra]|uniref:Transposase n=1 Tax=Stylosanthes scabra TaxID=79078 RepID=A0ABU6YYJ7_9FABA|nr:hypothetical protein [Stylosanthes scabra]